MAGVFRAGEQKVRPGTYFRITNTSPRSTVVPLGVVAVPFACDWGPLEQVVELRSTTELDNIYGRTGAEAARLVFEGGAAIVKAVRLGTGGVKAATTLNDTSDTGALKITARHEGVVDMNVTVRDSLADPVNRREFIIHSGTSVLTKLEFTKGVTEANALAEAINANPYSVVTAEVIGTATAPLADVAQAAFTTPGKSPAVTTQDYADALDLLEAERWDLICVDSDDAAVHALVKAFIKRVNDAGLLGCAVLGEPISMSYETRRDNAAAFNSASIIYVLNGGYTADGTLIDGRKAAALVAGVISSLPSNIAPTHTPVPLLTSVAGALSNTKIEECIQHGAIVLTTSMSGTVWIESGVNTLVSPSDDQDNGWRKIRRTRTRYELIDRINASVEGISGNLDNDANGRSTFIAIANGVGRAMIAEGKLISCNVTEDPERPPEGDSSWFVVAIDDLDSQEKIYITYQCRYAAN